MLLLNHAAAKADYLVGLGLFGVVKSAHIAQNAHFRVFADGAGVNNDYIRLRLIGSEGAAHFRKITADTLRVTFVLLAAVGIHKGQHILAALRYKAVAELMAESNLALNLLFFDFNSLVCHIFKSFSFLAPPSGGSCHANA
jgi:hypothetical protein